MNRQTDRLIYIDLIKVFLTCLVVIHHAGQAYGNTGGVWIVSEKQQLDYLPTLFFFNAAYMMGFYFFISGYFIYFSLKRKSTFKFIQERLVKLGIPMLFFMLIVFTPLHYILGGSKGNYLNFTFDLYFNQPPLSLGHLWFVASLLIYSFIYVLFSNVINTRNGQISLKDWYPLIYLAFLIPINVLVRQCYPIDKWVTWGVPIEVAHLPQYFSLFLLGIFFNKNKWLESIKTITGLFYLGLAFIVFISKNYIYDLLPQLWGESVVESFLCIGLCLGLIVIFKKYCNKMNSFTKIISDNSYGIYLFHLIIVIGLQLIFKDFNINTNLKFLFVSIFGIALSCTLSHLLRKNKMISKVI
jgi:glucans biosynthesis protein C